MHVTSNRNHPIVWSVSYSVVPKFTSRGVEHRIRNLSQDIPRMCRDRAWKLRFFKFFASNENERCSVHGPSIVRYPVKSTHIFIGWLFYPDFFQGGSLKKVGCHTYKSEKKSGEHPEKNMALARSLLKNIFLKLIFEQKSTPS